MKFNKKFTQRIYNAHLLWLSNPRKGKQLDLTNVDVSNLDMSNLNLSKSILQKANLFGTDLTNTNLLDADITFCIGNDKEIITVDIYPYRIVSTKDYIAIGCKQFSHKEWADFTESDIKNLDHHANYFNKNYRKYISDLILKFK